MTDSPNGSVYYCATPLATLTYVCVEEKHNNFFFPSERTAFNNFASWN